MRAIATSLHHPEVGLRFLRSSCARRQDTGSAWPRPRTPAPTGNWCGRKPTPPRKNIHDAWITERFGPGWGENPLAMTVADQDPNLAYGTDLGRTMRTTDGGATWAALYSRKVNDAGWTTTGLDVTTSYGIHFDPFDSKRVVHHLHRYRTVSQRRRRRFLDKFHHRRSARMAEHHLLGRLRSRK